MIFKETDFEVDVDKIKSAKELIEIFERTVKIKTRAEILIEKLKEKSQDFENEFKDSTWRLDQNA